MLNYYITSERNCTYTANEDEDEEAVEDEDEELKETSFPLKDFSIIRTPKYISKTTWFCFLIVIIVLY